ncbi:MAG: monovalent cation/H+ antiporter subunit D [Pirellulaceae bacterium]|nr:monovalent cation/H+ antiporter subunit D [Pirellulaceae bacterium]
MSHWLILPILIPAIVAPLLALAMRNDLVLARVFSVGSMVWLVLLGMYQVGVACDGEIRTYELGGWPSPFGIVLVLDRLSALMLLLNAILGLCVLLYAINGCDQRGAHFHSLFQFQIMGINGAFLTGDLFNLFVFFEILLIASYGLMVHAGGSARVRAGIQYVVVNLVGSSLFLLALGMIYSSTGTLNMAEFARQAPLVGPEHQTVFYTGTALMFVVFGIKSALVPLQFWLPGTYANTSGPVAALFAILSKVGAYAIIRVCLLAFGESAGEAAFFIGPWLIPAAAATLILGMIGVVASRSLAQQASFAALASIGTLFLAIGTFTPQAQTAGLYYLLHSTLALATLFLLVDAVVIRRTGFGDALVPAPKFKHVGLIASMYFLAAIAILGLPPLSGFVGKLLVLEALTSNSNWGWLWGTILATSVMGLVGFAYSGSLVFWKSGEFTEELQIELAGVADSGIKSSKVDHSGKSISAGIVLPMVAISCLLGTLVLLTIFSGLVLRYLDATSQQLYSPEQYLTAVLGEGERPVPIVTAGDH